MVVKIAFIIQDLCGEGAEYATALLVRGFIAKGYSVDLLMSQVHSRRVERGERPFRIPDKTNVIMLPSERARKNILAIRRYLKTTDAFAVIAMSGNYESAIALASVGLCNRPKLFTVEHGIRFALDTSFNYAKTPSWFNRERIRRRLIYSRFDGIFAVSEGANRGLVRMFGVNDYFVHTVYNPVIDEDFENKCQMAASHPWLVHKSCPTFVTAGTLSQAKDHMTLMKAVAELSREKQLRLIIFGEGVYRERYETFVRENALEDIISLPGFSMSLPAEVKSSDGYIASSLLESFGIAIVEALACKVPVVAADAPCGAREVLDGGRYGLLIPPRDVEAMKHGLIELLDGKVPVADDESWHRFVRDVIVERYERAIGVHA